LHRLNVMYGFDVDKLINGGESDGE
jgi:hypothetical protein